MFKIHSLTGRIFIGVVVGLLYSLAVLAVAYFINASFGTSFALGTVMHFVMMGFVLGFVGIYDKHPIFGFKMRWWIRGLVAGTIFGFIYVLLGYESLSLILQAPIAQSLGFTSPYWAMTDFWLSALIMAYMETHIAGEGSRLPLK